MPVVSGGSTVRHARPTYETLGTTDVIYVCGAGIMAHPGGIEEGVRGIHEAWEAAVLNIDIARYAEGRSALRRALEYWRV